MFNIVRSWVDRYFSDEQALVMLALLLVSFAVILAWGDILAPVIAAVIIAFILQGPVAFFRDKGLPKIPSVVLVFGLFLSVIFALFFAILPLVYSQAESLLKDFPRIVTTLQTYGEELRQRFPGLISGEEVAIVYQQISEGSAQIVQWAFSNSLASLPVLVSVMIYMIVVPLLVFFFLKDRDTILESVVNALPSNNGLITRVSSEMNDQFANYLRGKAVEIVVVGVATYIGFVVFGLNYSALLALLVGLSVVIPYIGAVVVTIPVVAIALFQFGPETQFYYVIGVYMVIQALDGNVLVPLLFSEAVNLHPILIIVAVLFFGGVWGFWGVFFAIPLATLVKAVITAWPRVNQVSASDALEAK